MLATAILDFWQMSTSRDTGSGTNKKFDPGNLLLCALELEICLGGNTPSCWETSQKTAAGTRVKNLITHSHTLHHHC